MRSLFKTIVAMTFGLCLVLGCSLEVYAQENSDEDVFSLEEITVTAQKREENQQKVAIGIDVISGDDMRELGYNNLDEILSTMSTAFINRAPDGMRVSIRGMSDEIRTTGGLSNLTTSTPTVAVNVDGVYTAKRNSGSGLYDMERVEVLYGPQSTLYSTSSPGGIVNIVTASPKTDTYEMYGSVEYGNYNSLQLEGMMNAPFNDKFALRAAFSTSTRDGYMENGSDDEDTKSARIKALYQPNDVLSFLVTGELTKEGGHGYSGIDMFVSQDEVSDPWDNSDDDESPPRYSNMEKINSNIDWDMGFATATLLGSYSTEETHATYQREAMGTGELYTQSTDRDGDEKGVELRLVSSSDSFIKWILGANYYRSDVEQMDMPESGEYEFRTVGEETDAFYGNITYPATDQLRLTLGLRKTRDDNNLLELMVKTEGLVTMPVTTSYDDWDYKIGMEYDLGPDSMLYADYSTSYRSVGMALTELDPERLASYTIGSKNRFFDNKFELNASAFYYDYTDYVADFGRVSDPALNGRSDDGSMANADLEKYGIDIQTTTIITNNDRLDFAVSYLSSEFKNLYFDFVNDAFPDLDYTGKPETFAPEWTININYSHVFTLPNGGALTARFDSRYQSDYLVSYVDLYQETDDEGNGLYNFLSQADYVTQEAHHISNLTLIYKHADDNWTITGYMKNIEDYCEKKNLMNGSMMIGAPRTYGVAFSVRY